MSEILYYSKNCNNCSKLIQKISRSRIKEKIHFICIDKRIKKNNNTYLGNSINFSNSSGDTLWSR